MKYWVCGILWSSIAIMSMAQSSDTLVLHEDSKSEIVDSDPGSVRFYSTSAHTRSFFSSSYGYNKNGTSVATTGGIDFKYGISNQFALAVTFNTDFSQTEPDNYQINLNRFTLFYPEKRQFFLEESELFDFSMGGDTRLFHSRRIGMNNTHQPIDIIGGLRIIGKTNKWDIGIINMQTTSADNSPSDNINVLRLRRQVLNSYSYIGTMTTSRVTTSGKMNLDYGFDASLKLYKSQFLTVKWAHTISQLESKSSDINSGHLYFNWEKRNKDGFGYETEYSRVGSNYNPSVGFVNVNNYTSVYQSFRFGKRVKDHSSILRIIPNISAQYFFGSHTSKVGARVIKGGLDFELLSHSKINVEYNNTFNSLSSSFLLVDRIMILPGDYKNNNVAVSYESSNQKRVRHSVELESGQLFNGYRNSIEFNPIWNISERTSISGRMELNWLQFDKSNLIMANIFSIDLNLNWNDHWALKSLIQYNSVGNVTGTNFRLQYNFKDGHDIFMVYDRIKSNNLNANELDHQTFSNSILMLKYVYTFLN